MCKQLGEIVGGEKKFCNARAFSLGGKKEKMLLRGAVEAS